MTRWSSFFFGKRASIARCMDVEAGFTTNPAAAKSLSLPLTRWAATGAAAAFRRPRERRKPPSCGATTFYLRRNVERSWLMILIKSLDNTGCSLSGTITRELAEPALVIGRLPSDLTVINYPQQRLNERETCRTAPGCGSPPNASGFPVASERPVEAQPRDDSPAGARDPTGAGVDIVAHRPARTGGGVEPHQRRFSVGVGDPPLAMHVSEALRQRQVRTCWQQAGMIRLARHAHHPSTSMGFR